MASLVAPELIGQVRLGNLPVLGPSKVVQNQDFSEKVRLVPIVKRLVR